MPRCPECDAEGLMCGLCIRCVRRFAGPLGVFPEASRRAAAKWLGYDPGIRPDGSVDNGTLVACGQARRAVGHAVQVICCSNQRNHMKHSLTLEFDSAEELQAYLAGGNAPKTAKGSPRNAAPPPSDEPDADEEHGITYDEISELVVRVSKEKGRDTAINLLKGFKNPANKKPATKGAEIAPADYPRAKAECEAALAEEEDLT